MLPLLIGAGAGLLKSQLVDKPQADRQRQLAATTAALSPWTGMSPTMPEEANAMGSMMQGGLAGAQLGQGLQKQAQDQEMLEMFKKQQAQEAQQAQQPTQPGTMVPKIGGSPWQYMGGMIA